MTTIDALSHLVLIHEIGSPTTSSLAGMGLQFRSPNFVVPLFFRSSEQLEVPFQLRHASDVASPPGVEELDKVAPRVVVGSVS